MDTRYLQTFREVAKCQSFTRAAEVLGYAQSSVTTQIQNLETEFGVTLFERWGRKIRLTHAGEALLGYSDQVLAILDEAKGNLSEQAQMAGTLSIGTVESLAAFYLPPFLQKFRKEQPRMRMQLHPGICHDLRQGVKEGKYDFAFVLDWMQDHPELTNMNLGEEKLVVVAAPDHPLTKKERVEAKDFSGESWIFTEAGCSYRSIMEAVLRDAEATIDMTLEFGSLEAIKQCVAYGLGIALVPFIAVAEEAKNGTLAILPFSHPEVRVYRQLIYHKKKWMSQALLYFLELLTIENQKNNHEFPTKNVENMG
ncbi:LysR family transcriptional regulator [Brevibacillus choshinensis]|uniref:LysR family transcriptional regulator n=1 Tax=Brevibacillus choshinensis TaxID=54911 RepID=A0ABR5N0T3_BRECH|nr:LysR family transcriptional regulator [Brevibacillus choshinensis]KQL44118.1 LysR family transcriptional regulator [Brevibacillus choshinensis]